jgi:RNA polymerase sigma-70 factor (ECF subfamily)
MMQAHTFESQPGFQSLEVEELIAAARLGTADAFEEIVRRYQARVYRTALKIVSLPEDAQDISQEVFMSILKHLGQYRQDAAFGTWITRIVINTSLMHLRKKKRSKCFSLDELDAADVPFLDGLTSPDLSPEQTLIAEERHHLFHAGLSNLPTTLRDVMLDRIQSDCSLIEIASRRGITVSAAKSRLLRARGALANEFRTTKTQRMPIVA